MKIKFFYKDQIDMVKGDLLGVLKVLLQYSIYVCTYIQMYTVTCMHMTVHIQYHVEEGIHHSQYFV